jgi:periplasmic divalent cation tolerance protein
MATKKEMGIEKIIKVYIPCPSSKEAEKVAMHLLRKRLIACANIFPIKSMYWWKGNIENTSEYVVLAAARKQDYQTIVTETKKIHPYDVPLIGMFGMNANMEYEKWLIKETKK